jgi:hypothetical protein
VSGNRRLARICLAALIGTGILASLPVSARTETSIGSTVAIGSYTAEEAADLGIDTGPTSQETGLPVCDFDPDWGGLAPDESVPDDARDDPASCVADRAHVTYLVGATPPSPGYHHNGYRTNSDIAAGADTTIEIRDPEVDHQGQTSQEEEFVVNRVLTQNSANDDWIEIGYGEHSWEAADYARVYTYVTRGSLDDSWEWFGQYNLPTGGNFVDVRTRNCTISGDDRQCADIWWSNQWQLLTESDCDGGTGINILSNCSP